MKYNGNVQLTLVMIATPELEAEGDRLWKSHAAMMEKTHYREGEKALLQYIISKGTDDDGNIRYVLTEVYKTPAGLKDHLEGGGRRVWNDREKFHKWLDQCETSFNVVNVIDSLW